MKEKLYVKEFDKIIGEMPIGSWSWLNRLREGKMELKSCPFCGGIGRVVKIDRPIDVGPGIEDFAIKCWKCSCTGGLFYELDDAVKEWNTRAADADRAALVAKVLEPFEKLAQEWNLMPGDKWFAIGLNVTIAKAKKAGMGKCICTDPLNGNPDPVVNPDCLLHGNLRKE